MIYPSIKTATFLSRPNRFIAHVLVDGKEEIVHVKNTGRCREILKEGATILLEEPRNPLRKTKYSVIAVYKGDVLINIDSQIPNAVVYEGIKDKNIAKLSDVTTLAREVTYGNSRFDLYFETPQRKGFIEVKGVTLEEDGVALFPDAPTERGCKHIYEMIKAVEEGYSGFLLFLIQLKGIHYFTPNTDRDPRFAEALALARSKGVTILAYDSIVTEDSITLGLPVEVRV